MPLLDRQLERSARATACLLGLALGAGCEPLVATIGIEGRDATREGDAASAADAPPSWIDDHAKDDGGVASEVADATWSAPRANDAGVADSAPDYAEVLAKWNCVHMPDLANPYMQSDGGIRSIDSGVIVAASDDELGCTQAKSAGTVYVTYRRVDGAPLLRAGQAYAVPPPSGSAGGALWWYPGNAACEQPLVFNYWWLGAAPVAPISCAEFPAPMQMLRLQVPVPSPLPNGFHLCESRCPVQ